MSPITSPDTHCPVKPVPSVEIDLGENESENSIDDIENNTSDVLTMFQDINKEISINVCHKPGFMEMDGTYKHNIEILLNFTYRDESESICNVRECNSKGPSNQTNALNHLKDLFKECAVAGGLNIELISHYIQINMLVKNLIITMEHLLGISG